MPDEPVFERIELSDPDEVKMLKLLNNIADLKAYAEKLKAVIECLNSAAATQTGISLSRNIVISPEKSND